MMPSASQKTVSITLTAERDAFTFFGDGSSGSPLSAHVSFISGMVKGFYLSYINILLTEGISTLSIMLEYR